MFSAYGSMVKGGDKEKIMKKIIIGIFTLLSQLSWTQNSNLIIIEPFAIDSITIDGSMLLAATEIVPKSGWRFRSDDKYEVYLRRAIDSTLSKNGNVLKILDYTSSKNEFGSWSQMKIEIYKVDNINYQNIKERLKEVNKFHNDRFKNLSWIRKKTVTKYEDGWYKENRFKAWRSIPRDSTTGKYLEVGVSGGMDIILAFNLHVNTELYLLNTSYAKISLSNKAGIMLVPMGEYYITYDSPGIKLAVPIKNIWLTATFGKEYIRYHVNDENYSGIKTDVIDKRIDIGLKFYKTKRTSIEFYYPLRLDDEVIPWWTGGIVMSANYRL